MDIPNIEVVVIFGAPDSLFRFYQVLHSLFFVYVVINSCAGEQDIAVVKQGPTCLLAQRRLSESVLQGYCAPKNTDNCLRSMLRGLESSIFCESDVCCSVCSFGKVPYPKLDVLKPRVRKYQKQPIAIRELSKSLMKQFDIELKREREAVMVEKPCYQVLGVQYICCDVVIEELCSRAHYVTY